LDAEDLAALERVAAPNLARAQELGSAWMRHMRRGDFAGAWEISDAVLRLRAGLACGHLPRHFQRVWDGEPLAGKRVLIRCYHGLGDTIQFIRYAPLVKQSAARVSVWAHPALLGLLRSVRGIDELLPLHAGEPEIARDVDVEVMELPHVFRSTVQTLPADVPYLRAPAAECGDRLEMRRLGARTLDPTRAAGAFDTNLWCHAARAAARIGTGRTTAWLRCGLGIGRHPGSGTDDCLARPDDLHRQHAGASGGSARCPDVDVTPNESGLAVDGRSLRLAMVSHDAAVPPATGG
jgi:hypothetical protein